jgi:hypothetical protein
VYTLLPVRRVLRAPVLIPGCTAIQGADRLPELGFLGKLKHPVDCLLCITF